MRERERDKEEKEKKYRKDIIDEFCFILIQL